jgi:hypothetical protein
MPPALTIKKEAHPSGTLLDDSILPWFFPKKVSTFRKTQFFQKNLLTNLFLVFCAGFYQIQYPQQGTLFFKMLHIFFLPVVLPYALADVLDGIVENFCVGDLLGCGLFSHGVSFLSDGLGSPGWVFFVILFMSSSIGMTGVAFLRT